MELTSGINAGRESLIVHGTALNAIADNLANVNTPGYKSERLEFADLVADSIGSLFGGPVETGDGVAAQQVTINQDKQGSIDYTDRPMDAAINGRGFFILNDGTNTLYTRAGNFTTDTQGQIIAATGENLMGYTAASPDTLVPLTIANASGMASATTAVSVNGNLDANSAEATATSVNAAGQFRTSITVKDSLGADHDVSLHFFKGTGLNWTVQAYVDGEDVGQPPGTPVNIGSGTVQFDQLGQQAAGTVNTFTITPGWANGAAAGSIAVDISKMTGAASPSSITGVSADGKGAGNAATVQIKENGDVVAVLDTGDETVIGSIALALFPSSTGLERVGDNRYRETEASGAASPGKAADTGRGTLTGAALETSNVDPATEFVAMIQYQRGYQASSRVIQTLSEILNTTIQVA